MGPSGRFVPISVPLPDVPSLLRMPDLDAHVGRELRGRNPRARSPTSRGKRHLLGLPFIRDEADDAVRRAGDLRRHRDGTICRDVEAIAVALLQPDVTW